MVLENKTVYSRSSRFQELVDTTMEYYCLCGYCHDLSIVPRLGYVTIPDDDYDTLIDAEIQLRELRRFEPGTEEHDKAMELISIICSITGTAYECPECGRLLW